MTFVWTPASLALSVVVMMIATFMCLWSWNRGGRTRGMTALELFRWLLIALVVMTFNQPEIPREIRPGRRPAVVVLHDVSASMQTRDVADPSVAAAPLLTRAEAVSAVVHADHWRALQDRFDVLFEPFSAPPPTGSQGTDLNAALQTAAGQHSNLRAVVLLSDGDWNTGESPAIAASALRVRDVPVFAVGVGSEQSLPDLAVTASDAPAFGVTGKTMRVPFRVTSRMPQDSVVTVTLTGTRGDVVTKTVTVVAMGEVQDTLDWKPQQPGEYSLVVEIPVENRESRADNNRLAIPVTIREEELRVLIVESTPRWEYRYLRNALERDPGVEMKCLLFHPDLGTRGAGRGYLEQFPTEQELFKYDVVFLGDVGHLPGQLTTADCNNLRQLVRAQAGGLVFLPGFRGHQHSFAATSLEELYPVVLDPARPGGVGSPRPERMRLTEAGRRSLLTRLEADDAANERIWQQLPGFHWHAAALRARLGTNVLAAHETDSTPFGRVPLIATRVAGTGKVLFMGIDGAWRWRKGVEDLYHYRFWGQVVRWMAYQRTMSQGESLRLFFSPDRPDAGSSLSLNANVLSSSGEPLRAGTVTVQTIAPSGRTDSVRLSSAGDEAWGLFTGRFRPDEGGEWTLITTCAETGARLETRLVVQSRERETTGEPARFDVLEEIAQITGGELTDLADAGNLINRIAAMPEPVPQVLPLRLWCHPVWAATLVILLGTFWTCRKLAGLA